MNAKTRDEQRIAEILENLELDEEEQNKDLEYIKFMGFLLSAQVVQLVADKSFRNKIEEIIKKNVEDELYYRHDDFETCLTKCQLYETYMTNTFDQKMKKLNE